MRTELPEKWCIKIDGGGIISQTLKKYASENKLEKDTHWTFSNTAFPYYYISNGKFTNFSNPRGDEITFEEFKLLVLNQPKPEPTYEIY